MFALASSQGHWSKQRNMAGKTRGFSGLWMIVILVFGVNRKRQAQQN